MEDFEHVVDLKSQLQSAVNDNEIILILKELFTIKMTYEILSQTKIGRALNKFKDHQEPKVKKLAGDLQRFWKKEMNLVVSTKPAKKVAASVPKPPVVEEVKHAIKTVDTHGRQPLNRDMVRDKFVQAL